MTLDLAAIRFTLALAGGGFRGAVSTGTLAILATYARDHGPEEVARWCREDPGWFIAPGVNTNQMRFGASLLNIGRFRTNGPRPELPKEVGP